MSNEFFEYYINLNITLWGIKQSTKITKYNKNKN